MHLPPQKTILRPRRRTDVFIFVCFFPLTDFFNINKNPEYMNVPTGHMFYFGIKKYFYYPYLIQIILSLGVIF